MLASYRQLCRFVWYLLALLPGWSTAQTFPAIAEVDLIFPRNDTYPPSAITPIVFAIQNSQLAAPLHLWFSWSLYQLGRDNPVDSGLLVPGQGDLFANFSSSDPFFAFVHARQLNHTESVWGLEWSLFAVNCSATSSPAHRDDHNNVLYFTTKNGA